MQTPELEQLAFLDAAEALRRHVEALNYRRSRLLWIVLTLISFAAVVSGLDNSPVRAGVGAVSLLALLVPVPLRRREAFARLFSLLLISYLLVESALWLLLASEEGLAVGFALSVVCPTLLFLRLRGVEQLSLAAVNVSAIAVRWLAFPAGADGQAQASIASFLSVTIATLICGAIGWSATQRARQEFLIAWRQTASRERERLRMREEIHDARAIQLAMLPAAAPQTVGLDIAGVCVPATEVGGDYFDYFPLAEGELAIAIGDVAGHGVASGLVLAGVRAGLHLLAPEIDEDPAGVLTRLNRIVAGPGGQRLLMTLGLARFDRARGRASWVAAGHPPPLRWSAAEATLESPTTSHPPLGTKLPIRLEVVERPLQEGDVWLLLSDGALESRNAHGREFGEGAIERTFGRLAATGDGAGAILDGVLAELSRFRGGQPQEDDLTLVVVRASPT